MNFCLEELKRSYYDWTRIIVVGIEQFGFKVIEQLRNFYSTRIKNMCDGDEAYMRKFF